MGIVNNILAGASGQQGYLIANSLRFQSASSQNLTRTPASNGNLRRWTWSGWVKRGLIGSASQYPTLISTTVNTSFNDSVYFNISTDVIEWNVSNTLTALRTTQVFRDPSAWYHIVLVWDTDNATAANRARIYVNGSEVTAFSIDNRASISARDSAFNRGSVVNYVGGSSNAVLNYDGYMAEINFIDGQALTPSSFGESNVLTGSWVAKKYTGTYGSNGFYLPFNDGTSTTTLGQDRSGNANNWTLTNFTRSAGVSDCWMLDVPSGNGSPSATQPSSNYCVLNPLNTGLAPSNANLNLNRPTASWVSAGSTIQTTSGKWYFEAFMSTIGSGNYIAVGLKVAGAVGVEYGGQVANSWAVLTNSTNLSTYTNNVSTNATVISATTSMAFQVAVDFDAGKIWFGYNNTWLASGNPSTGANPTYTFTANTELQAILSAYANNNAINFGQRSFAYTPPSGFKALCTANLPAPTIAKGNQYMDATLYTGDGTTNRAVVNAAGFAPDFVWVKSRSSAASHLLVDSVRGASAVLYSNSTIAEQTINPIASLNSNGFSVNQPNTGADSSNINAVTYVGWQWNAGGSTVTNTSGTISSQVRASTTAGFSIVTYTGTGANATVGHGLGVAPKMVIVKNRSVGTENWNCWHIGLTSTAYRILLNLTNAQDGTSPTVWNSNINPTSTTFSIGSNAGTNGSGNGLVAYCFAEIAGFSRFGSYTGNGSADGPMVYLGFQPKYWLVKRTDGADDWFVFDSAREPSNSLDLRLSPNASYAEASTTTGFDFLANGVKVRSSNAAFNASGGTYIYMAFASNPFAQSNSF